MEHLFVESERVMALILDGSSYNYNKAVTVTPFLISLSALRFLFFFIFWRAVLWTVCPLFFFYSLFNLFERPTFSSAKVHFSTWI